MKFIEVPTDSGLILLNVTQIISVGTHEAYGTHIETAPTVIGESSMVYTSIPYATVRAELVRLIAGAQVLHSFCTEKEPTS